MTAIVGRWAGRRGRQEVRHEFEDLSGDAVTVGSESGGRGHASRRGGIIHTLFFEDEKSKPKKQIFKNDLPAGFNDPAEHRSHPPG